MRSRLLASPGTRKRWLVALKAVLAGAVAGALATSYRQGIASATQFARWVYPQLLANPWLLAPWGVAALAVGLLTGWLIHLEPMANGSGIPQIEGVLLWGLRMRWFLVLPVRFVGGLLCGLFGMSMGREGPSIQIGGAGAQAVAQGLRSRGDETNYLVTGGAAAGLSAAFNAPLSGMMFALEEVHRNFSPMILASAAAASLSADFVSKNWFGMRPVLHFSDITELGLGEYWWMVPLGVMAGLLGALINKLLLGFQTAYQRVPYLLRPALAIAIALPCGLFMPLVLGGGEELINVAEHMRLGIGMLLAVLVVKVLFTSTSFGSGIPGGIFMPILAAGTAAGGAFAMIAARAGLVESRFVAVFAVCAMAGTLAASVKAPVTSILLTVEMSGSLVHMLPVTLCAFAALFVSDMLKTEPIYEALMERYMRAHPVQQPQLAGLAERGERVQQAEGAGIVGANAGGSADSAAGSSADAAMNGLESAGKTSSADNAVHTGAVVKSSAVLEYPVELGSVGAGREIAALGLPEQSAVVGIRRGQHEIVPRLHERVMAGDYVRVAFPAQDIGVVRERLQALFQVNEG